MRGIMRVITQSMASYDNPPLHYDLGEFSGKTPLFQYTSSGRLNGWTGNLDLDVFYGDSADWDILAGCVASDNYNPSEPNHKAEDRVVYYTVRSGDTLSRIAQRYNTTYKYLAELNGIANPNLIYPGQVLTISGAYSSNTNTESATTYTVKSGDCLTSIGKRLVFRGLILQLETGFIHRIPSIQVRYWRLRQVHNHQMFHSITQCGQVIHCLTLHHGIIRVIRRSLT